jgi:hypothetical protein
LISNMYNSNASEVSPTRSWSGCWYTLDGVGLRILPSNSKEELAGK